MMDGTLVGLVSRGRAGHNFSWIRSACGMWTPEQVAGARAADAAPLKAERFLWVQECLGLELQGCPGLALGAHGTS